MEGLTRALVVSVLIVAGLFISPDALAADSSPATGISVNAQLSDDSTTVRGTSGSLSAEPSGRSGSGSATRTRYQPICDDVADSEILPVADVCHRGTTLCGFGVRRGSTVPMWVMQTSAAAPGPDDWLNTGRLACVLPREATPEVVLSAEQFRRLPIPALDIIRQPYPGHTLINIETNFLTEPASAVLRTRVLGQAVQVRATPASFTWTYGDGGQLATRNPGARYPNMPTAHVFTAPGTYDVQLTTTYTGEFSVGGGPWQPIGGTADVRSRSMRVTAEERRAVLVS